MFSFLLYQMYYDRRGMDENHPGQNLRDKKLQTKRPEQKPPRTKTNPLQRHMYVCVYY